MNIKFENGTLDLGNGSILTIHSGTISLNDSNNVTNLGVSPQSPAQRFVHLDELEAGDVVWLDGKTFEGLCTVEKSLNEETGKVFLRLEQDERTGREWIRLSITQEDIDAKRVTWPDL